MTAGSRNYKSTINNISIVQNLNTSRPQTAYQISRPQTAYQISRPQTDLQINNAFSKNNSPKLRNNVYNEENL